MTATEFAMPRTFDPHAGASARHLHHFQDVPAGDARTAAIARVFKCIKHPAVPADMMETALNVAHSAFAFGPNKRKLCGRDSCPCGFGHEETVEHTFKDCARSRRLWDLTLAAWGEVTGEKKLRSSQGRVVLFGDRSQTWATEAEEAEWAGLEEPWAIVHKVVLHTLFEERNKDAAPHARARRTAAQLYQKVQAVAQRIMQMRWDSARASARSDKGEAAARFRKLWEAPGLAVISPDASLATLTLFMREKTRARWRRHAASAREFRNQQFAPPDEPPADMIEIFTAGDADARKKNAPPPPAGYGAAAVVAGSQRRLFDIGGQIVARVTPDVRTTTANLADLVAVTRALQWASEHPYAVGRPICIRYNSEYAARIASGVWKAKKHKEMAAAARRAWAKLQKASKERVWLRHVISADVFYAAAGGLAQAGKGGSHSYSPRGATNVD